MRSLVVRMAGQVGLEDFEEVVAQEGEVLIAPLLSGVCGTDLELIDGSIDPAYVRYPLTLGHEWVGELLSDVEGVAHAGDRVVVEGIVPCGECAECLRGDTNRCVAYDEIGFTRPGSIAQKIAVPASLVHRLEQSVSLEDAVLVEPMAVVWRALNRIPLRPGLRVAVVGDGTVALLAAYMVRLFRPDRVMVIGRRSAQSQLALAAGVDEFLTTPPPTKFDLVIEAAGNAAAVKTALSLVARGAELILLGLAAHGTVVEIAPDEIVNDDLMIQGSFSYTRQSWRDVVQRVNAGDLQPSFLITHRYDLENWSSAFNALRGDVDDSEPRGKVTISLS